MTPQLVDVRIVDIFNGGAKIMYQDVIPMPNQKIPVVIKITFPDAHTEEYHVRCE